MRLLLPVVALALLLGTGCESECGGDEDTSASLKVPEGAACPPPNEETKAKLGPGVLDVLGPASAPMLSPGSEKCCYEVDVHEAAVDEIVHVSYEAEVDRCESVEECRCIAGPSLLFTGEGTTLQHVPDDAMVVAVVSGPTYDSSSSGCAYEVRVRRPDAVVRKKRCTRRAVDRRSSERTSSRMGTTSPSRESGAAPRSRRSWSR
jgi:hypothetical protein